MSQSSTHALICSRYRHTRGGLLDAVSMHWSAQRLAEEAPVVDQYVLSLTHAMQNSYGIATGHHDLALEHAQRAIQIIETYPSVDQGLPSPDLKLRHQAHLAMGDSMVAFHRWEEAMVQFDLTIFHTTSDSVVAYPSMAMVCKAHCLMRKGYLDAAWKVLEELATVTEERFGPSETYRSVF